MSSDEIAFGVACTLLSTAWGALVLRVAPQKQGFAPPAAIALGRGLAALPWRTVKVGGALLRTVVSGVGGPGLHARAFDPGRATDEHDAGRRAAVTLGLSLTPDSFVIDIPAHRREILLHRLVEASERGDARWPT